MAESKFKKTNFFTKKRVLFLLFLFGCSLIFYRLISYDRNILALNIKTEIKQISGSSNILTKNKIFGGEFKAKLNNLGIVSLRFVKTPNVDFQNRNILEFKLKEAGEKSWQSSNQFSSTLISNEVIFPFGFLPIKKSKGKNYKFEIESLNGDKNNALVLPKDLKYVELTYKLDKKELLSDLPNTLEHFITKAVNAPWNYDLIQNIAIAFSPMLIYLLLEFVVRRKASGLLPIIFTKHSLMSKKILKFILLFLSTLVTFKILMSLGLFSLPLPLATVVSALFWLSIIFKSTLPYFFAEIIVLLFLIILNIFEIRRYNEYCSSIILILFGVSIMVYISRMIRDRNKL